MSLEPGSLVRIGGSEHWLRVLDVEESVLRVECRGGAVRVVGKDEVDAVVVGREEGLRGKARLLAPPVGAPLPSFERPQASRSAVGWGKGTAKGRHSG